MTRSIRGRCAGSWPAVAPPCRPRAGRLAREERRRLLLGGVEHALGELDILEREAELVRAQLLGLRAEPGALQTAHETKLVELCFPRIIRVDGTAGCALVSSLVGVRGRLLVAQHCDRFLKLHEGETMADESIDRGEVLG